MAAVPMTAERLPEGEEFAFLRAADDHFHRGSPDEALQARLPVVAHDDYRIWVVRDGETIVGNLGVYVTDLSLPGGTRVPVAGVSGVGVASTHRRRGALRAMMLACFEEAVALGEPVAALYASEGAIYGRFGFGPSMPQQRLALPRLRVAWRDPVDPHLVEGMAPDEAVKAFPPVFEAMRDQRPCVGVIEPLWTLWLVDDPPAFRDGAGPRQLVHVPGRGWASYRVRSDWAADGPDGTVVVNWLLAADPEAEAALWQHVCDVDLTTRITTGFAPPDAVLPELLVDRKAVTARSDDPVQTRLLDVPAALTAREYATVGVLVLRVHDVLGYADGTYRLDVGPDGASCEPAGGREPDLELPVDVLSSVWLGGVRATQLLAARRLVEHRPGAAALLDRLFAADRAPWTPFLF